MSSNDRFTRQADLVPRDELEDLKITVIGAGAIGRQAALQLACLGARHLQLVDFDRVEETNLTTQGYRAGDLGMPKVQALQQAIGEIDPAIKVTVCNDRFRPKQTVGEVVFCCVDSMTVRAAIWRCVRNRIRFLADGRMRGEVIRVLTVAEEQGRQHYPTTLFSESEAQNGRCTAASTIYAAGIAAGWMVHELTRWLRRLPVDPDVSINLLAGELISQ